MGKLKVLDLFSGIGGFSLGLERTGGFETVAFCEIDPFCQKVLRKHWPDVPIYNDVRNLQHDGPVDVITGGFPCQDISVSGRGKGITGERSGLWKQYARLVGKLRPKFAIVENSSALLSRGLGVVLGDLAEIGYDAEWHCFQAAHVGAPHGRDRIWVIANPHGQPVQPAQKRYLDRAIFYKTQRTKGTGMLAGRSRWPTFAGTAVLANGVRRNMDASIALGNAVVPQIPEIIGHAILQAEGITA